MNVFIAHSLADRGFVASLATLLREGGETVFVPSEMTSGSEILSQVSAAIRSADVVVAVLTSANANIFYELGLANGAGIPTLIAAPTSSHLPAGLASTPFVQLTGEGVRDSQVIVRRVRELGPILPSETPSFDTAESALKEAAANPEILESFSPSEFERLVKNLLRERGYTVLEECPDDWGVDFIIESDKPQNRVLVQVKKTSAQSRVSVDTVRKLLSAASETGTMGMIVATSDYTAAALDLAAGAPVALWTLDQLLAASTDESFGDAQPHGLATSLVGIASSWMKKGAPSKAIEYFERAVALQHEIGDRQGEASSYGGIASSWRKMGHPDRAIEYFERAVALQHEIGDRQGEASSYGGIASSWRKMGHPDRAIEYFERAVALQHEIGDRQGEASSYGGIASSWRKMGHPDRAIEYFERAVALQHEIGDRQGEASSYGGIASSWIKMGHPDRAIEYFERAAAIQLEAGDRYRYAASLNELASVLLQMGNANRAIECFEQAAAIQREIGDRRLLDYSLRGLAQARLKAGELQEGP